MTALTTSNPGPATSIALCFFLLATLAIPLSNANADSTLDLATSTNSTSPDTTTGEILGAIFNFGQPHAGTGNFISFVRIQAKDQEAGYNTDAGPRDLPFDEKTGPFTHSVLIGDAPVVKLAGKLYFEFLLDVNEAQNGTDDFLSLDEVKIFQSDFGNLSTNDLNPLTTPLGTLVYDLDAGMNNTVLLNTFNSGSGEADYSMLVPVWAGVDPSKYLTFYSSFGGFVETGPNPRDWTSGSGAEEWALDPDRPTFNSIPESSTGLILAVASVLFGRRRNRRS